MRPIAVLLALALGACAPPPPEPHRFSLADNPELYGVAPEAAAGCAYRAAASSAATLGTLMPAATEANLRNLCLQHVQRFGRLP